MRYSQTVHDLLWGGPHQPVWEEILSELGQKGFVTEAAHFRLSALDTAFKAVFSEGFEDVRLDWMVRNFNVVETAVRAASRAERTIHPVHVILMYLMAKRVDQVSRPRPRQPEHTSPLPSESDELENRRRNWLSHLNSSQGLTRTQMRKNLSADWAWLYRHDYTWLQFHQVDARHPDGGRRRGELPEPMLQSIRTNFIDYRASAAGREPLASSYQIRLGYGMEEYAFARTSSALAGGGSTAQLPGRKEVFVTRRVADAESWLGFVSRDCSLRAVARAARLRLATVKRFYQPR